MANWKKNSRMVSTGFVVHVSISKADSGLTPGGWSFSIWSPIVTHKQHPWWHCLHLGLWRSYTGLATCHLMTLLNLHVALTVLRYLRQCALPTPCFRVTCHRVDSPVPLSSQCFSCSGFPVLPSLHPNSSPTSVSHHVVPRRPFPWARANVVTGVHFWLSSFKLCSFQT